MVCENERFSISLLHYFSNQKSAGRKGKITKTKILGKLLEEKFQISAEMDYSLKFLSFRAIEISRQFTSCRNRCFVVLLAPDLII